jgi:hypothetical protein
LLGEAEEETEEDRKEEEKYKHKKKTVLKVLEDYYEVLGLGELRWRATAEDIKKACKYHIHHSLNKHNHFV